MVCRKVYRPHDINVALLAYKSTKSLRAASAQTNISKSSIHRWFVKFGYDGMPNRRSMKRGMQQRRRRNLAKIEEVLAASGPCVTQEFIQQKLADAGTHVSISCISRTLKAGKYIRRRCVIKAKYCSSQQLESRIRTFINEITPIDLSRVISLDETGLMNTSFGAQYAYVRRAQPLEPDIRYNHRRRKASCAMAVTTNGLLHAQTQDANFHKSDFVQFFRDVMSKRSQSHHDIVVMDNISFHHSEEIHNIAREHRVQIIFTPPYSPQFNPIEMVFSDLKREFRKRLYMRETFGDAITHAIQKVATLPTFLPRFEQCLREEVDAHATRLH